MRKLLPVLTASSDVEKNVDEHQSLTKQFADVLNFAFEFDDLKMTNPAIQNDFSFYRRVLSRPKTNNVNPAAVTHTAVISDEIANKMSLFYAYPTPMLKTIIETVKKYVNAGNKITIVSDCLSTMSAICFNAITKGSLKQESVAFCLRVMVASIVMYDHVNPQGAFHKNSPLNVRSSVKAIQTHGEANVENLMNALRFNTVHLNDDSTPKATKALLV